MAHKKQQQFLVPPPPPTIPGAEIPLLGPFTGAQFPRQDLGYNPVQIPPVDRSVAESLRPNPERFAGLRDVRGEQAHQLDLAQGAYEGLGRRMMPMPELQEMPFQRMLSDSLQQAILENLSSRNTFGSRFNRGFDMGQKIAAAVAIPALGAFSKGPAAMGFLQATEAMKHGVRASESQRTQEQQQINQALVNLASLYQNLDPKSAKNQAELLRQKIAVDRENRQLEQSLFDRMAKRADALASTERSLLDAEQKQREAYVRASNAATGLEFQGANLLQRQNEFASTDAARQAQVRLSEEGLGLRRQAEDRHERQFGYQRERDLVKDAQKEEQHRAKAIQELAKRLSVDMRAATAVDALGNPKYAGYAEYLQKNPASKRLYEELIHRAGLEHLSPDQVFGVFREEERKEPGFNWAEAVGGLVSGANTFNQLSRSLLGAPAVKFEQIATEPERFLRLTAAEEAALRKSKNDPGLIEAVTSQLTRVLKRRPTGEEVTAILNKMEQSYALQR